MIELALTPIPPSRPIRPLRRMPPWAGIACAVALLTAALAGFWWFDVGSGSTASTRIPFAPSKPARPSFKIEDFSVAPEQLRTLSATDAASRNNAIPIADGPNPAAKALSLLTSPMTDWERAQRCLTSAIYYEAAHEPEEGQRAVAQVVLNRVRHPLYPKTVCGVVFQGHQRSTGCQFSFTCDGSLARTPEPRLWERTRRIAAAALAGSVYTPVGLSTNYHADYVVPYWISSLKKVAVVGRHIFYRLPGAFGGPASFRLAYAGNEAADPAGTPMPALAEAVVGLENGDVALLSQRPLLANTGEHSSPPAQVSGRPATRWLLQMDAAPAPPTAQQVPAEHGKEDGAVAP